MWLVSLRNKMPLTCRGFTLEEIQCTHTDFTNLIHERNLLYVSLCRRVLVNTPRDFVN